MDFARARVRYLAAIGLPIAVFALPACADKKPERDPRARPRATSAAPAPSASALADHELACERGTYCVPAQKGQVELYAAPPFETCSVIEPLPAGTPPGWPEERRRKLRLRFNDERTAEARKGQADACCYMWFEHCAGRVLRVEGAPYVTPAAACGNGGGAADGGRAGAWSGDAWSDEHARLAGAAAGASLLERQELSAHWLREASMEHASIAAFARASLELLALGAPPDLLSGVHAAALDEVRHARVAYALAAMYAGVAELGPAPFPAAALPFGEVLASEVARATFIDGCAGEAVAALALAEAARRASDPGLQRVLAATAEDEARHAELAYRIVAWLLRIGGAAAAAAVRGALELLLEGEGRGAPAIGQGGSAGDPAASLDLARFGVLGVEERRALWSRAVSEVITPCALAMLEGAQAAGPEGA